MTATLEEVLQYRNEAVVSRFVKVWSVNEEEAQDIFQETLKWLWLGATIRAEAVPDSPKLVITEATRILDEMWHTFLLFTFEYAAFCQQNFGFFLHHHPTTEAEQARLDVERARDPEAFLNAYEACLHTQCSVVYDRLGEATVTKWYATYLDRYGDEFMNPHNPAQPRPVAPPPSARIVAG